MRYTLNMSTFVVRNPRKYQTCPSGSLKSDDVSNWPRTATFLRHR